MKKLLICTLLGASLAACADAPTRLVGPDKARQENGGVYGSGNDAPPAPPSERDEIGTMGSGHAVFGATKRGMSGRKTGAESPVDATGDVSATSEDQVCYGDEWIGTMGSGHRVIVPCP